jgi:hypothetical protein
MSPSIRAPSGLSPVREKHDSEFPFSTHPGPEAAKNTARSSARSDYCRKQAADCLARAAVTTLADVKDAYLQLEQAWLKLIPDFDPVPGSKGNPTVGLEGTTSALEMGEIAE